MHHRSLSGLPAAPNPRFAASRCSVPSPKSRAAHAIELTHPVSVLALVLCMFLAGCGSGESTGNPPTDTDNTSTDQPSDDDPAGDQSGDNPQSGEAADESADTNTGDSENSENPDQGSDNGSNHNYEQTPIETLQDQIRKAAGIPIIDLNDKLSTGAELTEDERICLGDHDRSTGKLLTRIDCKDRHYAVYGSPLHIQKAQWQDTDDCQQALSDASTSGCRLNTTVIEHADEWQTLDDLSSKIANITLLPGFLLNYDAMDANQLLIIPPEDSAAAFSCTIDLSTMDFDPDAEQLGNCVYMVDRAIGKLHGVLEKTVFD